MTNTVTVGELRKLREKNLNNELPQFQSLDRFLNSLNSENDKEEISFVDFLLFLQRNQSNYYQQFYNSQLDHLLANLQKDPDISPLELFISYLEGRKRTFLSLKKPLPQRNNEDEILSYVLSAPITTVVDRFISSAMNKVDPSYQDLLRRMDGLVDPELEEKCESEINDEMRRAVAKFGLEFPNELNPSLHLKKISLAEYIVIFAASQGKELKKTILSALHIPAEKDYLSDKLVKFYKYLDNLAKENTKQYFKNTKQDFLDRDEFFGSLLPFIQAGDWDGALKFIQENKNKFKRFGFSQRCFDLAEEVEELISVCRYFKVKIDDLNPLKGLHAELSKIKFLYEKNSIADYILNEKFNEVQKKQIEELRNGIASIQYSPANEKLLNCIYSNKWDLAKNEIYSIINSVKLNSKQEKAYRNLIRNIDRLFNCFFEKNENLLCSVDFFSEWRKKNWRGKFPKNNLLEEKEIGVNVNQETVQAIQIAEAGVPLPEYLLISEAEQNKINALQLAISQFTLLEKVDKQAVLEILETIDSNDENKWVKAIILIRSLLNILPNGKFFRLCHDLINCITPIFGDVDKVDYKNVYRKNKENVEKYKHDDFLNDKARQILEEIKEIKLKPLKSVIKEIALLDIDKLFKAEVKERVVSMFKEIFEKIVSKERGRWNRVGYLLGQLALYNSEIEPLYQNLCRCIDGVFHDGKFDKYKDVNFLSEVPQEILEVFDLSPEYQQFEEQAEYKSNVVEAGQDEPLDEEYVSDWELELPPQQDELEFKSDDELPAAYEILYPNPIVEQQHHVASKVVPPEEVASFLREMEEKYPLSGQPEIVSGNANERPDAVNVLDAIDVNDPSFFEHMHMPINVKVPQRDVVDEAVEVSGPEEEKGFSPPKEDVQGEQLKQKVSDVLEQKSDVDDDINDIFDDIQDGLLQEEFEERLKKLDKSNVYDRNRLYQPKKEEPIAEQAHQKKKEQPRSVVFNFK